MNSLCSTFSPVFSSWSLNRQCEALHHAIITAAHDTLPQTTVLNTYTSKRPVLLDLFSKAYSTYCRVLALLSQYFKFSSLLGSTLPRRWTDFITQLWSFVPAFGSFAQFDGNIPTSFYSLSLLDLQTFQFALCTYCKLLCTNLLLQDQDYQSQLIQQHIE